MKVKELFKSTNVSQTVHGTKVFLDKDNCQIINKTKNKKSVILRLKRQSDGEEGQTHLRVQDRFEKLSAQLLRWAFISDTIGLTLNQLDELETNWGTETVQGRIQLIKE